MKSYRQSLDINDLSTWKLPVTLGIALLLGFAAFLVWGLLLQQNSDAEIGQIKSEITQQKKLYRNGQLLLSEIPLLQSEVNQLKETQKLTQALLPTTFSMPALVEKVYEAAQLNHIVFNQFTPKAEIDKAFYSIKPVVLAAEVNYIDLLGFVRALASSKRMITVHSMTLEALPEGQGNDVQRLKMTAELHAYRFKEKWRSHHEK